MPNVSEPSEILLFAVDTNITHGSSSLREFRLDLFKTVLWPDSYKLTIKTDKTTLIHINQNFDASSLHVAMDNTLINPQVSCNFLGVTVGKKLRFTYFDKIKSKL